MMYRPTGDWDELQPTVQHDSSRRDLAAHVENASLVLVGCCWSWLYLRRAVASLSEFSEYAVAYWVTCSPSKAWAMTQRRHRWILK
jgi:hypothetical protein